MKKTLFFILMSFVTLSLLNTSCSIEKRHYMAGYNVDWKSNKNLTANHVEKVNQQVVANNLKQLNTEPQVQNQSVEPVFHQVVVEKSMTQESTAFAVNSKKSETVNSQEILSTISKAQLLSKVNASKKALALFSSQSKSNKGGAIQIVALLLCLFLGMLGIHSFYLGNKKKGIIQLVMFLVGIVTSLILIGYVIIIALGIWVLIDFIRILIGDLGPGW